MQRVVVIGNSGGGKSLLARQIAERFRLPYIEIDTILWQQGWRLVPDATYAAEHARLIAGDSWVIDGLGKRESIAARLERATEIVVIELPLWMHFWLAAGRQIAWSAGELEHPPAEIREMPPTKALFENIWEVDRHWMPEIRRFVAFEARRGKGVFHLTSLGDLDRFVSRI